MVSTYLGYELYARDLSRSLQRVKDQPANQQAKAYYDANIGKVKSVDDFLNNYRLFSYAMKSFGLEDMTYAKGLMRQVLTSDLTSSTSVANRLSDSRYLAFAKAYNFDTTGAVKATSIQSSDQQAATVTAFETATADTLSATKAAQATLYYKAHIGSVTSVDALEKDQKLYNYVLTAFGIDPTTAKSKVESVIQGSLTDSRSATNSTAAAGYLALHQAVTVTSTGAASTASMPAQDNKAIASLVNAYAATVKSDTTSQTAAQTETAYYTSTIANITTVDALVADKRLVAYVSKAFGLPTTSATTLKQILTSDPSDKTSFAAKSGQQAYTDIAAAFNFTTSGALRTVPFQDATQQQDTVALYRSRQTSDTSADATATAYYQAHIGNVKSVSDLEADGKLLSYVLKAYGLSASTSHSTLEQVLEQDPTTSGTVVDSSAGSGYLALHQAFTVDSSGRSQTALSAQSSDAVTATATAYLEAKGTTSAARLETSYYQSAITAVTSVSDLVSDKRLVAYVVAAYGLPSTTTATQLGQILTSDPTSKTSVAAQMGSKALAAAAAFSFGTNGLLVAQAGSQAQSTASRNAVDAAYAQQVMEDDAGTQNEGIKLALYFQNKASTISNSYDILADKALLKVVQTMLNLSSDTSKGDIDSQANYLTSKLNFADFKDPAKLDKLVQRFSILYDMQNSDSSSSDTISQLFGTGSSS